MWQTRREFLGSTLAGGIAVVVSRVAPFGALPSPPGAEAASLSPPGGWSAGPGKARFRIDGLAKVTGQKIYARDFQPRDMPDWPVEYRHALVVRADFVDHLFEGIDLGVLPRGGRPAVVITGEDLARDKIGIAEEDYPEGHYLVKRGERPSFLGQEVAILLFDDRTAMQRARKILLYERKGIRRGKKVAVSDEGYFQPEMSVVHVAGDQGGQKFAQTLGGPVHPTQPGPRNAQALRYVEEIDALLQSGELEVFGETYHTQVIDPMFMEPENGLGWLDPRTKTLHLLIGTQSPGYDVTSARALFAPSDCKIGVETVHLYAAYPGGGFGGRDTSILCLWLSLAAAYSDKPIRIENDRYQQFQSGIKRHAAEIEIHLGLDAENRFRAIRNRTRLNGGGRINVSTHVADVAGLTGAGPYAVRLADIWSRAQHTVSLVAGSMRGFGAFQSTFALESLVDQIAETKRVDPIELRLQNLLPPGAPIVSGAPVAPPGGRELCEAASRHPLWVEREARKKAAAGGESAYGVGFALAMKNYGAGADAVMSAVWVDPAGGVHLSTNAVDMGQGLATTLALSTATALGRNAESIQTGEMELFEKLELVGGFAMQKDNPRWTPIVWNSTKSSSGAARWVHSVEQASLVLLEASVLPAARTFWGDSANGLGAADLAWQDGKLVAAGFAAIPFPDLARRMHERKLVTAAMVHAFFSSRWISGEYSVDGLTRRWPIDALAVRRGSDETWDLIDRRDPHLFTVESTWQKDAQTMGLTAALVAVQVHHRTGEPRVVAGVHLAAPGKVLQQQLVMGQMEGCWAMGIGHALLEDLPPGPDGAADATWNLHRYHVALSGDVALHATDTILLPPESPHAPARGMGEVPLNSVAPAVANAIAHATGHRFRDLPITAAKIRAVWS